ncbi:MAG: radical SAM protein [Candidatus Omnitrophica bacterium]|nr:radical SAM protein [Candidatus Omnitrophota bacterium]
MQRKGAWTTVWPPVTLATMAGMLLKEGVEVRLNDCIVEDIGFKKLKDNIAVFKPDILVINTATASIYSDLLCARAAKEASPRIKTLALGLHVTMLPEEAFVMEPALDFIIRGEPEFCFMELVKVLAKGQEISAVKGLSYRKDGLVIHNQDRGFDEDLNDLAFPAWQLIDTRNYLLPLSAEPFLLVTTSKGCPYSCLFCPAKPFYGSKLRLRDYKKVVDEMEYVYKNFGVGQFLIWSESFTANREYVFDFCNEFSSRGIKLGWVCNSRVDKVDLEMLKVMKKAGCWMIGFGIESGSQEILDNSGKGATIKQAEEAVDRAKKAGMEVVAHVIFGLPGETLLSGKKTIAWLNKLKIDFIQVYCAVPWPSTPLYALARKNGWLKSSDWRLYEQNHCVLDTGTIKPKEVEYLRRLAVRKFYSSLKRLSKMALKVNSVKKLRLFIKTLREFLRWI